MTYIGVPIPHPNEQWVHLGYSITIELWHSVSKTTTMFMVMIIQVNK